MEKEIIYNPNIDPKCIEDYLKKDGDPFYKDTIVVSVDRHIIYDNDDEIITITDDKGYNALDLDSKLKRYIKRWNRNNKLNKLGI